MILYEYPFNERLRTYLRLEKLMLQLGELLPRTHALDHHFALATIFEIMDVAARADLKTDVLKDIEKNKHQLESYRSNPSISEAALDAVIARDRDDMFLRQLAAQSFTQNISRLRIEEIVTKLGIACYTSDRCDEEKQKYFFHTVFPCVMVVLG